MLPNDLLDIIVKHVLNEQPVLEYRLFEVLFHRDTGFMYPVGTETTKGGWPLIAPKARSDNEDNMDSDDDDHDVDILIETFTHIAHSSKWEISTLDREVSVVETDYDEDVTHFYSNIATFSRHK